MTVLADLPWPPPAPGLVYLVDDAWPGAPSEAGLVVSTDVGWLPMPFASLVGMLMINEPTISDIRNYLNLGTAATQNTSAFDAAGAATSAINAHLSATDPHTQYTTEVENDARYAMLSHTHSQSDVSGLTSALAGKAASVHTHSISDVTSLQTSLDAKEPTISAGSNAQYWRGDKTWQTLSKGSVGLANVDNTSDANKPVSTATQSALDGKAPSVHTHAQSDVTGLVTTLAGKEASITAGTTSQYWRGDKSWQILDKTAVGLSNVDNTSDANKPISSAVTSALSGKAASVHTHAQSDITNLVSDLSGKAPTVHTHAITDVIGLQTALDGKSANSIGSPTSRSLSLGTAYQATTTTKPSIITVNLTSNAALTLTAGTTNTAQIVIGSTNAVASGTGTVIGQYSNSLTGTLVVGLAINTAATSPITFALPPGWYFAIRQTSGTVTIASAFDQTVG